MILPHTLVKKTWRDLRNYRYQVLSLAVILGIGASVIVGFEHLATWRKDSLDKSYESLNMMDFQIDLLSESYANVSDVEPLLNTIEGIVQSEFRLVANAGVNITTSSQFRVVQGRLIGINVTDTRVNSGTTRPSVNNYYIKTGQPLSSEDAKTSVCLLQHAFADYYALLPSQSFSIILSNYIHTLTIQGLAYFTEFFYISSDDRTLLSSESQFAAIYLPLSTLQNLLSLPGRFNQLIVRTTKNNAGNVQIQIESALKSLGYDSISIFREELATYHYLYESLKNDHEMYRTISALFLLIAGLGTYIMISRLVSSQRRLIGISQALGYRPRTIIGQYTFFSVIIGVLGSIIANILGIFLSLWYNNIYSSYVQLPYWQTQFQLLFFAEASLACPLITSIAGFLPAFRSCRMKPVDAIRLDPFSDAASQTRPGTIQKFVRVLPLSISVKLPLRNVLRNRRRTLSTIFGLAASVILAISMLGVFDSFDTVMRDIDEDLGSWDLSARSSGFELESNWESILTSQTVSFERWEVSLDLTVKLTHDSHSQDVFLSGVQPNSTLRPIKLNKGSFEEDGIIISSRTAESLDLSVNDDVIITHLMLGGLTGHYLKNTTKKVVGIHDSVIALMCYMNLNAVRSLIGTISDLANLIYLKLGNLGETSAQKIVYELPGVVIIEFIEPVLRDRKADVDEMRQILWPALFLSAIFTFAMVMNTVTINVSERIRETGTMLTLGTSKWIVARMLLIENLLLGFFGLGMGMILGQLILDHIFINGVIRESLPQLILPVVIFLSSWIFVFGLFILTVILAQLVGIRRAVKLDLAAATKVRE
ncbi:MAG: ABC transporter permease [Promethearchaeota archaeon]